MFSNSPAMNVYCFPNKAIHWLKDAPSYKGNKPQPAHNLRHEHDCTHKKAAQLRLFPCRNHPLPRPTLWLVQAGLTPRPHPCWPCDQGFTNQDILAPWPQGLRQGATDRFSVTLKEKGLSQGLQAKWIYG